MNRLGLSFTLLLLGSLTGVLWANEEGFNTEFNYQQAPHPKAKGRLKEGYQIQSHFNFDIPKAEGIDWSQVGQGYLQAVSPGIINLGPANDGKTLAGAPLPCDVRYIFSRAKEIEAKGKRIGFGQLSSPERSIYNFSKKYIRDQEQIRFSRLLTQGTQLPWDDVAQHFDLTDQPLWILEEKLSDFNQFAIEGWVRTVILPGPENRLRVVGEISLTLDADILDKRVIGLLLSVPLKAALKGMLPTKAVFSRVADKLKSVETGSTFACQEDQANAASLIYGVPNFVDSYLNHLRTYLGQSPGQTSPQAAEKPAP